MLQAIKQKWKQVTQGRSSHWSKVRKEHLSKHPECAACGTRKKLEVHHIKTFDDYPELELDPDNLMTLCEHRGCHFRIGHSFDWRASNPNAVSDAALQRSRIATREYNRECGPINPQPGKE